MRHQQKITSYQLRGCEAFMPYWVHRGDNVAEEDEP